MRTLLSLLLVLPLCKHLSGFTIKSAYMSHHARISQFSCDRVPSSPLSSHVKVKREKLACRVSARTKIFMRAQQLIDVEVIGLGQLQVTLSCKFSSEHESDIVRSNSLARMEASWVQMSCCLRLRQHPQQEPCYSLARREPCKTESRPCRSRSNPMVGIPPDGEMTVQSARVS
jgi:hypothetical protein